MQDLEGEVIREPRGRIVAKETFTESLSFPSGDHTAPPGGDWHRARPPEYLQLHRSALHAGDAQGHPSVVDLIVGVILQQSVRYLGQAESLLGVHHQADDPNAVDDGRANL